jgi:hypothetical protein
MDEWKALFYRISKNEILEEPTILIPGFQCLLYLSGFDILIDGGKRGISSLIVLVYFRQCINPVTP